MVTTEEVIRQFHHLGIKPSFWARGEVRELGSILVPGEHLMHVVFGWYENGFALLCCTNYRVLLIDKKPLFLKMEDLRYDKISEIRFLNRLLDSTVILSYAGMRLDFKSWNQAQLRKLTDFVQETITMINRQQWHIEGQSEVPQTPLVRPVAPEAEGPDIGQPGMTPYPDELMRQASVDLGLMKNPYAPSHKFMRRRVPHLGFNQSSR